MKKLHKKLRKVVEHIDLTHLNQVRHLKNLAMACDDFELAVEMRGLERAAEQELAESSRFSTAPEPGSNLKQMINRPGWAFTTNPLEELLKNSENVESPMLSEQDKEDIRKFIHSRGEAGKPLMEILGNNTFPETTVNRGLEMVNIIFEELEKLAAEKELTGKTVEEEIEEEPTLLVNSIKTPDGTILTSRHRHDYVCHKDSITDTTFCIDGGLEYRRIVPGGVYQDLSVYSDDPFEKIRESLERVHRGKNLDQPMKYVVLKDMNDAWLDALIVWIEDNQPNNKYKKYYLQEIEYRKANGITVKEEEEC
jgi:hypothetical protein